MADYFAKAGHLEIRSLMNSSSPLFDPKRVLANRRRARACFHAHDFLHQGVWQDLMERKSMIKRLFTHIEVHSRLFFDENAGQTPGENWQFNPLGNKNTDLDLIISMFELHLIDDLQSALTALRTRLKPDGVTLGALFGGQTLFQLRQSLLLAESELFGSATARIIPMVEIRDLGALVQASGFALPVVDVQPINVRYPGLLELMRDLRFMGEGNPLATPIRPMNKALLKRTEELYRKEYGNEDGTIPARFDVLHFCGWAPDANQPKPLKPGSGKVFLGDALKKN